VKINILARYNFCDILYKRVKRAWSSKNKFFGKHDDNYFAPQGESE